MCGDLRTTYSGAEVDSGESHSGETVCSNCAHACTGCDEYWLTDSARCEDCQYERDHPDDDDWEENDGDVRGLLSYSHKPFPIFHGDGPLFLGVEQEMEFHTNAGARAVLAWLADHDPNMELLYAKHDGSLVQNGVEIVSHPMSPE